MEQIRITPTLALSPEELEFRFVRSPGPGGQNVNKVATAVELRFDAAHSPSLPEPVRARLLRLARGRISSAGVLVLEARRFRSQERNRTEAVTRLVHLLRQAAQPPKARRPTRPSATARRRRLEEKRRRGQVKRMRRAGTRSED
jgi:ribosome-associated protein